MTTERIYSEAAVERARAEITRAIMVRFGGDLIGPALVGVEVSNADCIRYIEGATIEELMA